MSDPSIHVLGVYRLGVTEALVREQLSVVYPPGTSDVSTRDVERKVRRQLESVALIELSVRHRDARFRVDDFAQSNDDLPRDEWQVAWAETFLTRDGESLAVERWSPPPSSGDLRIAFFIHDWVITKPLMSSYGDLACPLPQAMPARLAKLVPYEPLD